MRKKVNNILLLRSIDEVVEVAITKMVGVLNDPKAKNTEILNSADKLVKLRFQLQESVRKEISDRLDIEMKQLNLEEKQIKLEALRGIKNPNSTPAQVQQHSRVFHSGMKPTEVNDEILKTG